MTKIYSSVEGDDILKSFSLFLEYIPSVALEMMSRAGDKVRKEQRTALEASRIVYYVTREDALGKKHLVKSPQMLEFGQREKNNTVDDPSNMSSFINSYLMESSMTLVVNGTHPSFTPIFRRDGEVVGAGSRVKGVGKRTHAILQRMNDSSMSEHYPTRTALSPKRDIGTGYAQRGTNNAMPKVRDYLFNLYGKALKRAEENKRTQYKASL